MQSSDYWAKRFKVLENASNRTAKEAYATLEDVFSKMGSELDKEILAWIKRIAKNNNVKLVDARKMLTKKERKEFNWDVQEYIKKGRENGLSGEYLKELENASAKYHINRLDTLNLRLKNLTETAFNTEHATINSMLKKVYTNNYYKSLFEVQKGFNIGFDIAQVDTNLLDKLLTKPWTNDNLNFSDRIWMAKDRMVQDLQQELVRTCVLGKSPDESIKRMSNFVNKKVKNAKMYASRLIMTEQAAFHARSQEDAFKELDIEEFEIVATLDSHTSEICREMDGKHFPMEEYKIGITAPPFHVYCRSVTAPYFNDEWSAGKRAARDENGKTYYVPSDMTYPEWKRNYVTKSNKSIVRENNIETKLPLSGNDKSNYDQSNEAISLEVGENSTNNIVSLKGEDTNLKTILTKEELSALTKYISFDSYIINDILRNSNPVEPLKIIFSEEQLSLIHNIDSALSKLPKYEGNLLRDIQFKGLHNEEKLIKNFEKNHQIGGIITYKEFISTTTKASYHNNPSFRIYIQNAKKGKDLRALNEAEGEVLYERNTSFRVLNKVKDEETGIVNILLEEL